MSPIPGIDDSDDDQEDHTPASSTLQKKRPLEDGLDSGRDKRVRLVEEVDDEDRDLYGEESAGTDLHSVVSDMTLVTERLPVSLADFVCRLLSTRTFYKQEVQRLEQLYGIVRPLQQIEVTNVFQVTFATCLSLDAAYRQKLVPKTKCVKFYPYLKIRKPGDIMELHCFSFADVDQPVSPTFGQLVSVYILPIDSTVSSCRTFAYVEQSGRRLPDKAMRMEVDLMSHLNRVRERTLIQELVLNLPFSEELYHTGNFHVEVAPICLISDLLMQARAVYEIGTNPLFRYFQTKDFSLSPTGLSISADQKLFSPQQLEAIQRAFDLVMSPFSEHGNPCKAVFTDGDPQSVRSVTIQTITELVRATDLQFIVSSSDRGLFHLRHELYSLPQFESRKSIFFLGHEDSKLSSFCRDFMDTEVRTLRESIESEADESKKKQMCARIQLLTKCLDCMSQESGSLDPNPADVQDTMDEFGHHALQYSLRSARLIFGTLKDFSRSPELIKYLKSPKAYPSIQQTPSGHKRKHAVSACMIADAESLTDPQLMAFSNDFSVHRFILSSSWSSPEKAGDAYSLKRPALVVDHSFKDRVKLSASTASNTFIVDVSPSE